MAPRWIGLVALLLLTPVSCAPKTTSSSGSGGGAGSAGLATRSIGTKAPAYSGPARVTPAPLPGAKRAPGRTDRPRNKPPQYPGSHPTPLAPVATSSGHPALK